MKKILFFINSLSGGGAEKVLVDLLNLLSEKNFEIDLISIYGGVHEERLSKKINYKKIINTDNVFLRKIFIKIFFLIPKCVFRKMFIRNKYNIEIAYLEGFPTSIIAAGNNDHKKIAFVHCDSSKTDMLSGYYNSIEKCMSEYEKFDNVCFVSMAAKNGFEKRFGTLSNSIIVHNFVNTNEILEKSQLGPGFVFDKNKFKIISVGRLTKEKGYDRLIRISAELEKEYDLEVCILGEGEQRESLENLIEELNVGSVRMPGFFKNPYSIMKQADLFVCSSLVEGYSTVVTEARVLGIPILTTDCAGMCELIKNGENGIIVENSEKALLDQLKKLIGVIGEFKTIKTGADRSRDNLSMEKSILEFENIIEK